MKRMLISGSNGLLGQRLSLLFSTETEYEALNTSRGRSFVFDHQLFDYTQLDLTKKSDVKSLVSSFQPDIVINAAAATDVDWCETHRDEAWKINVAGVENLVEAARKVGAKLIHVSTDYIFDGKHPPYREEDRPNPICYYGKTKLAAENAILIGEIPYAIVRTIILYGSGIGVRENFPLWVVNNLKARKQIRCAEDQISNPTYVGDLANAIVKIVQLDRHGIYHVCGSERISRYDFAVRAADTFRLDGNLIQPVKSADLKQAAARPPMTSFITLKAETELGLKMMDTTRGLTMLKQELEQARRN